MVRAVVERLPTGSVATSSTRAVNVRRSRPVIRGTRRRVVARDTSLVRESSGVPNFPRGALRIAIVGARPGSRDAQAPAQR